MDTKHTPTKPPLKPIEIFRPGSFVAMNGKKYTFTPEQVQEMADTYKPDFADAPLVVGHPKLTSPRFGHAGKLFVNEAGVLCAEATDVVPEFAEAVNAKHYPKVSASIYLPDAPGNPTPGRHYLRHIGFLGGAAPAVKGLKSVEFSESDEGIVDFAYEDRMVVQMFRNIRDWLISTAGLEKADQVLPSYQLDSLTESAMREENSASVSPAFSNPISPLITPTNPLPTEAQLSQEALDQQAAALAKQKAELDARAAAIATQEAAIKKTTYADFAESLCDEGKLLPVQKSTVIEILSQLDDANQVADFAQGDENFGKTGADLFRSFLASQPKQVEFKRVSPNESGSADTADFAAPPGAIVNEESNELYKKAKAYQAQHPDAEWLDAVKAVSK